MAKCFDFGQLLQNRIQFGQHLVHDVAGDGFQLFAKLGREIESPGLIATHNAGGLSCTARQGNRESGGTGETAATGNRKNHRNLRQLVKGIRRHDENGPSPFLFMSRRWIKADQPDFTALHLDQFIADRLPGQPSLIFRTTGGLGVALGETFVKCVMRSSARLYDEWATLDGDANLDTRFQLQKVQHHGGDREDDGVSLPKGPAP